MPVSHFQSLIEIIILPQTMKIASFRTGSLTSIINNCYSLFV